MKNKIKIISLSTTYPEAIDSATPKFVHIVNKELVTRGCSVKVIAPHSKGFKKKDKLEGVTIQRFKYLPENYELSYSIAEEVRKSKLGMMKIIFLSLGLLISTFIECLKEKPDIIHGHWAFPGGYIASFVSKIFGINFVVSLHGGEIPLLKKFSFLKKLVINSLNKSSFVIVNSNYTKNEFEKMGVLNERMIKINPPPNFLKHCSDNEILSRFKQKFVKDDTRIILFCGRLTERKGVAYLIQSIPEIKTKNIHLIIVGGGGQEGNLKQLTSSLNLDSNVTFFGPAKDNELGLLHDISDVFVCPSIIDSHGETEGLGLVIPEAMESGLPVIGTSVGGIVDIIKNGFNGVLVEQKDPVAIAKAIDQILGNPEFAKKIIQNSKQTVKDFSPEIIAKQHMELFEKLVFST